MTGKKNDVQSRKLLFFLLLTAFFLLPYLFAVLRLGLSELKANPLFWCNRLLFPAAAAALVFGISMLCRQLIVKRLVAVCLWLFLQLFIMLECFQLCFTGNSFNEAFLMHFSLKVLMVGLKSEMGLLAIPALLFLAAAGFALFRTAPHPELPEPRRRNVWLAAAGFALWFVPLSPVVILSSLIWDNCRINANGPAVYSDELFRKNGIHPCSVGVHNLKAERGKNLVFIIVESLEQNYLNPKSFPGLMPQTEKLLNSKDALYFQAMRSDAVNTFDFLYKSHMGTHMENVFAPQKADKLPSLSMILQKAGYRSSFLKSCSLDFSDTRGFLQQVHYQRMLDCDNPEIRQAIREIGAWGFRDYDLFAFAEKEFDRLSANREPFIFTVLTVDGHAPNGVLGKKSLTYRLPDGQKFSLLSAIHTTDAAMGKFIEHIRNSPVGANTLIAVSGDHRVMKNIFASGNTVQSLLAEKPRQNVLCFMLNGTRNGVVTEPCWPVDLAPMLLYQMGVRHNYVFPSGINALTEKGTGLRSDFSREYLAAYLRVKRGEHRADRTLKASSVSISGTRSTPNMHIGDMTVPLLALQHMSGVLGVETDLRNRDWTSVFPFFVGKLAFFQTSRFNPNFVYFFAARPDSILHTMLNVNPRDQYLLCALQSGWFRCATAQTPEQLKIAEIGIPPAGANAEWDLYGHMFCLRGNGWTLPLFSVNGSIFPFSAVVMLPGKDGRESLFRIDFDNLAELNSIVNMMSFGMFTMLLPPDSLLHEQLPIAEEDKSSVMRIQMTRDGKKFDFFPFHGNHDPCILRRNGKYYYLPDPGQGKRIPLTGEAFNEHFSAGWSHTIKFDSPSGKIKSSFSYKETDWSVDMLLSRPNGQRTLMMVGKNSTFIEKYYPDPVSGNVLFCITPENIRHAIQYSNGDFRIPRPDDPIKTEWPISVRPVDNRRLVITWGDATFIDDLQKLQQEFASGAGYVIKISNSNPVPAPGFLCSDPGWDQDIVKSETDFFIYIGSDKCRFPALLDQPVKGKYFLAIRRQIGWKVFWNDKLEFHRR